MLSELIIRNFAIIDRLAIAFGTGFQVLTGETGAGKSIIIDAVALLLGGRARPELIRSGEEEAIVEGVFDLDRCATLRAELAEAGLSADESLIVRRIVSRSGKNRIYINGSPASVGQLQQIVGRLVSIYGQHEHQALTRTENHLLLLDRFAQAEEVLTTYRACFEERAAIAAHIERLCGAERERRQRHDLLSYQVREIAEATLRPGEDDELATERLLLQNVERLLIVSEGGYAALYGDEGAVCEALARVAGELEGLSGVDPQLAQIAEGLRNTYYAVEDAAALLRAYAGRLNADPRRLADVDERLARITTLKRKYATDIAGLLRLHGECEAELAELADLDGTREELRRRLGMVEEQLHRHAEALSQLRRAAAQRLAERIESELHELAMPRARFEARLFPLAEPGPRGRERIEFHLAPNPGEEAKPLVRIASGGELSRLMLAVKRAAPGAEEIPTLIFDEVDAGIGGAAATKVGEKLKSVGQGRQVLCITHLPQVAAFADQHYRVVKHDDGARTRTELERLDCEERVTEMSRMLGGATVTPRTLAHARELIALSSTLSRPTAQAREE